VYLSNLQNMRIFIFGLVLMACTARPQQAPTSTAEMSTAVTTATRDTVAPVPPQYDGAGKLIKITKSDADWKALLTAKEYNVLRQEGTEYAFSGDLWNNHEKGVYVCRGCQLPLFSSETKFDSGTGWPSFYQPIDKAFITENTDNSHGMVRVEVECARCGGHQGHVFDDGPPPTNLRYCINSVSLDFIKN
jgi:peptide-methionine (R)-S-oxide reductase